MCFEPGGSAVLFSSLSRGTEWSPNLEVVCDITSLALGVQLEVVLLSLLSLGLDIDILVVIPADGLSLSGIKRLTFSFNFG